MSSKRITLRDVASVAGVHYATVSRALKGDPEISAETQQRLRRIAKEMGYVPDPILSALTAYRSANRPKHYRATIAWVSNEFNRKWDFAGTTTYGLYFLGAKERAASYGYTLEEFWLREPGMNWKRNNEVLKARGINGLIVAPQPRSKMRVRLDWPHFSAVAIGYSTAWPDLHIITNDQFHSMVTVVRNVRSRGYRRIACWFLHKGWDERIDRGWTGGFLAQQQRWAPDECLPIFYVDEDKRSPSEWIKQYRPDVILGEEQIIPIIIKTGYRIPEDIGFASYASLNRNSVQLSGIDENAAQTGAAAVDLLVGMLNRAERGIPKIHQRILIEGTWLEGTTLRPLLVATSS